MEGKKIASFVIRVKPRGLIAPGIDTFCTRYSMFCSKQNDHSIENCQLVVLLLI